MIEKTKLQERCEFFIKKGWTYNYTEGIIYSHKQRVITSLVIRNMTDMDTSIPRQFFCWYCMNNEIPDKLIGYIDGDKKNIKYNNLFLVDVIVKEPISKKPIKRLEPIRRQYIKDIELVYEVIISKGKGKMTAKLQMMFIKIVNELSRKFYYKNGRDREDCISHAILSLFENWNTFNELKYNKALPYYTEIAKRAMAKCMNILKGKNKQSDLMPNNISLSNWM